MTFRIKGNNARSLDTYRNKPTQDSLLLLEMLCEDSEDFVSLRTTTQSSFRVFQGHTNGPNQKPAVYNESSVK
jgi:hypothetical protein